MGYYVPKEKPLCYKCQFRTGNYCGILTENEGVKDYVGTYKENPRCPLVEMEEPQTWIPVSERLPEELAEVNITWTNTNPEPYYDFIKDKPATGSAVYYKGRWYWYSAVCTDYLREYGCSPYDEMDDAIKVLAWMPLPKAYEVTE